MQYSAKEYNYTILVQELKKRFTPEHLQAVQSSLFYDQKQKPNGSVDLYTQELHTLFYRSYPQAQQDAQETEQMARVMLANQFAAGQRQEVKAKVAGPFEKLFSIAKFEEAKLRDILPLLKSAIQGSLAGFSRGHDCPSNDQGVKSRADNQKCCFSCNSTGHFSKNCPVRGRAAHVESQGRNNSNSQSSKTSSGSKRLSVIVPEQTSMNKQGNTVEPEIEEILEAVAIVKVLSSAEEPDSDIMMALSWVQH